jgi:hypothetical protein
MIVMRIRRREPSVAAPRSPGLRLIASDGRLATRRLAVVCGALAARLRLRRAVAIWPSAQEPMVAVDPREWRAMAWLDGAFPWLARPQRWVGAATWHALRARALLVRPRGSLARAGAEHALGRPLASPRLVLFSPSRSSGKVACFVFEGAAQQPLLVVKAMAQAAETPWLAREIELVARLRGMLAGHAVADALPLAPLFAGPLADDWLVVEPFDPLASAAGRPTEDVAIGWLRTFQAHTARSEAPWDAADDTRALAAVAEAWRALRPHAAAAVYEEVSELLAGVRGARVQRCAVHGDYWRGNLAVDGAALRVFDWEWGAEHGDPFMDRWCLELGELHPSQIGWEPPAAQLAAALARTRAALARDGVAPAFALATLAPVVGALARRRRSETGTLSGWGPRALPLMRAVERLLAAQARDCEAAVRKFGVARSV